MKAPEEWMKEPAFKRGHVDKADIAEVQADVLKSVMERLNQAIPKGHTAGNGCDDSAQRNGVVMAYNEVRSMMEELK